MLLKNSSQSTRPIIRVSGPPSSSGMTYSPMQGMKTSIEPAMIPALESGTVIFQKPHPGRGAQVGGGLEQRTSILERVA